MEEKFIKVTNAAYKVLEFFPEADPLKYRAKDKALVIMENLAFISGTDARLDQSGQGSSSLQRDKVKTQISEDIDILLGYLWIGKVQGWLSPVNHLIISNEYEKIKKDLHQLAGIAPYKEMTKKLPEIDKEINFVESLFAKTSASQLEEKEPAPSASNPDRQSPPPHEATARQGKIIEFLEKNEKAQVMDLQKILPDITKRTIRRDLDELLESGKIDRFGEFNQVFYKIKRPPPGRGPAVSG